MSLSRYFKKRDFAKTPEPRGTIAKKKGYHFYIQKHAASHLHYDFRLELGGVLKSFAIPKGPSLNPKTKRLAILVEDHPLSYGTFEGIIPKGEYGGGTVLLWDQGYWQPLDDNPLKAFEKGHLRFILHGEKLNGRFDLLRFKHKDNSWFLVKYSDEFANDKVDITKEDKSVLSNQNIEEIKDNYESVWSKKGYKRLKKSPLHLPKKPFPKEVFPQLTTLVDKAPVGNKWLHEIKFDGYRILAFKKKDQVTLLSRNQKDWTASFPNIVASIQKLPIEQIILDGEIVLLDDKGRSSFQLLQNAVKGKASSPFIYYLFDLLYYDKWELRTQPLIERKALLEYLLDKESPYLRYSAHIIGEGQAMFKKACDLGLEGIISKESDSNYVGKRTKTWLKVKCIQRQEFVIGGFSLPKQSRLHFGSLFLGFYNPKGQFIFAGNVGTGFNQASLNEVYALLKERIIKTNPFHLNPPGFKAATWVKPELVAEVEFSEWTKEGHLRHPSFKGLRADKNASQVKREEAQPIETLENAVILTNPNKILYPEDGFTKQDLLHYYEEIASHILPFITQRPLTLVRCPSGYQDCFYQKKLKESSSFLHVVEIKDSSDDDRYIYIDNQEGLFNLAQLAVLEIHPWGARIDHYEYPDWLIFDLDPSPELPWKAVVSAAFEVKHYLEQYQLKSFVKTTGGKGLHVVVPIKPEFNWDQVKNFSHVFVQILEQNHPNKYLTVMSKAKRQGKLFIDYLRNQRGATAIAAYSPRARLHAPVSTPLAWDELTDKKEDNEYTILTLYNRLRALKTDPWAAFWTTKQSLKGPEAL